MDASMHSNRISPVVIAAALSACALEPESLNSERMTERFGSCGIDILDYESGVRRSSLYSLAGDTRICRTYAVVVFAHQVSPCVSMAHADILAGESIGATFKSNGWKVRKTTLDVGTLLLDATRHPVGQLMQLAEPAELAMHAYELRIEQDPESIHYATIVEVHHPDYLSPVELHSLYDNGMQDPANKREIVKLQQLVLDSDYVR
jgi:hypothetical protein